MPSVIHSVHAIIQFEPTNQWPEKWEAIQHTKTAFYLLLSEKLKGTYGINSIISRDNLTILFKGYAFGIEIFYHKELEVCTRPQEILFAAELERRFYSTKLHGAVHGMCLKYPAMGNTSRLAKTWLSKHMLSGQISDDLVDLLVLSLFTCNTMFASAPTSHICGFLRFLHLIATFDWVRFPLIVNVFEDLSDELHNKLQTKFIEFRQNNSEFGMIVVTQWDENRQKPVWQSGNPSKQVSDYTFSLFFVFFLSLNLAIYKIPFVFHLFYTLN